MTAVFTAEVAENAENDETIGQDTAYGRSPIASSASSATSALRNAAAVTGERHG
jgi:hypothetical protein